MPDAANTSARRLAAAALGLISLTLILAPAVQAGRVVSVSTKTYSVWGATEDAIRASIDKRRPGMHDAYANWRVSYSYRYATRGSRCVLTSWAVRTRIVYTMPRWVVPAAAPQALRAKWARYVSRLRLHEEGHGVNARAAGWRIDRAFGRLSASTCAGLTASLERVAAAHVRASNLADAAYDRRTRHGATQGATFP